MKLEIEHPEDSSLEHIISTIEGSEIIRRSPHVGLLNNAEIAFPLGVNALGGQVAMELVDTIQGDDPYSTPHRLQTMSGTALLASKSSVSGKIVGSCIASHKEAPSEFAGRNLADIHQEAIRAVMPDSIYVGRSSAFLASGGQEVLGLLLKHGRQVVGRPMRRAEATGKIVVAEPYQSGDDVFGVGDNPLQGYLMPLEGMMACELILTQLDGNRDARIVHVGGKDMVVYTKDRELMKRVTTIAERVLVDIGIKPGTIEYVVPSLKAIVEHPDFPKLISTDVVSQHDILRGHNG